MKNNKKGFTLIEMLVVIAIIAILVAVIIPTVSNATEKAKQATDLANIRSMVAQYQIDNMNGNVTSSYFDSFTKKAANGTVTIVKDTDNNCVTSVTYYAPLLKDGNGSLPEGAPAGAVAGNYYTWTLGDLVTGG